MATVQPRIELESATPRAIAVAWPSFLPTMRPEAAGTARNAKTRRIPATLSASETATPSESARRRS